MSDTEPNQAPPKRTINLGATIVGGIFLLPLMALSAVALMEGIERTRGYYLLFSLLQILGLAYLWWRIARTERWPIIILYILLAAGFYLLMLGLCAAGGGL